MSQPNRKFTRLEALLSEFKSVGPNPVTQSLNSELDALKAQVAFLDAELQENRKKLQSKIIESETIPTNFEAKSVEALLSEINPLNPNPINQSLNREVDALKTQVASLDAELQENRKKLQSKTIEFETILTALEAKPVETPLSEINPLDPNPINQSLNREVDALKAQLASQDAELQENRKKLQNKTIESETIPPTFEAKPVETRLSEFKALDPNPIYQPLNSEMDALKAKVASQNAELRENRKKLQSKSTWSDTVPPTFDAMPDMLVESNEKQVNENNQRNAYRVLLAFIVAQVLLVGFLAFQTALTPSWQLWLMDGLGLGLMAFEIIGLIYVRRGRHELGIWLSFIPFLVMLFVIPLLYSGLGFLLLVCALTIITFVGSRTLPQRQSVLFTRIALFVGAADLLMDFFIPFQRATLPGIQNINYFALIFLLLVSGYVVVRQFRDFSLRTKLLIGFLSVLVLASLGGLFAIIQQSGAAETTAVTEASNLAESISSIVDSNRVDLQSLVVQLHETQGRDVEVVGPDLRILADADLVDVGLLFDVHQNSEVAATLQDGQPRTFVEITPAFPQGLQQIVAPVVDESTGEIIGAVVLDFTRTLQKASFAEAASIAEEINATVANDPSSLQTFISTLFTARKRNLTVVDPQRNVLADSNPEKIGTVISLHQNGEVAETLKDGQPRSFIEISPDFPEGQQQTITPVKDSAGNIIGVAILGPSVISKQNAIEEATQIAETLSAEVSKYLARLQGLVTQLSESQGRDMEVIGLDLRILADAAPEDIGKIIDNPTGEIAATLKDGQQRTYVEINAGFPQGIKLVVVPVKDSAGKISGAVTMEYTPRLEELQQAQKAILRTLVIVSLAGLVLALVSGQFISSSIANPISQLKDAALKIGKGQLNTSIPALSSKDEVGILANALNSMALQLRDLFGTLEKRIQDRTHDIELAAEVGRTVNERVSNLYEMLNEATEMIRSRFDLYYTQVYLLDSGGDTLSLRAGTGEVGQQLLQRGHHLLVNSGSLNGRAVSGKKPIIVADTAQNPTFLPNPFLPDTRSEMAVPLIVSGRVLGVLDMQSEIPGALNESNLSAFEALAGQMAIAIQNATLFRQSEDARKQVEATVRGITTSGWQDFLNAIERGEKIGYTYNQTDVFPMENLYGMNSTNALKVPITVTGATVGSIQLVEEARNWTSQETEIVQAAAQQLAQHIDNLRLLAQAESYRAEAEQSARRLTREGWESFLETRNDLTWGFTYDRNQVHMLEGRNINERFETAITKQFLVRNESIGELAINTGDNSPEDINGLISAVAEQLGGHIENLRLSEQNEMRTIELEKLVIQLRELDRLKSAFLANMSHELRTPLNSILGFADVMLEELDGPLTENMNNDLKLIHKNGQHLLQLINDVLDMAKIESGKMNLNIETFNVQEAFEEVVSITSYLAHQKNIALFIEPDSDSEVKINADKIRVRQVMINLVNNAMKFTDQGKVSICVKREHLNVHITVNDTGIGIPVDQLESVFQEFTQVDTTTTRKAGGTGLGLPISRRLIEMHSGRLWVESSGIDGEGSTFHALLPIEAVIKEQ